MRSRYADYPEYHTSLDDLETVVTPSGLQGGLDALKECINVLENEPVLLATELGEPQLGKRGLYHTMLNKHTSDEVMLRTNLLAYADGQHDINDMVEMFKSDQSIFYMITELKRHELLSVERQQSSHQ
jgi:aminopeptidase-like protein